MSNTQDDYKVRAIDVRHINPSIMEGERGLSSILGQGSAIPIVRYAPTFLVQPTITGSFKIPSTLTCNPGVIDASPQALVYYQWKADGVDIPGETNKTITTSIDHDKVSLSCDVDAVNFLGTATGTSNGIVAELIEPIRMEEHTYNVISGLNQSNKINLFDNDIMVATGISQETRLDTQQGIVFIGSGLWVETRKDVTSCTLAAISGGNAPNEQKLFEHEVYAYWQPDYLGDLPLVNPNAETGDMTGWTVLSGTIDAATGPLRGTDGAKEGSWYFSARNSDTLDASMQQTVSIGAEHDADIDAGMMFVRYSYLFDTYTNYFGHGVQVVFEIQDAADTILHTESMEILLFQNEDWLRNHTDLITLPANSRKIRCTVFFKTDNIDNRPNETYVDDIRIELFKDAHQV